MQCDAQGGARWHFAIKSMVFTSMLLQEAIKKKEQEQKQKEEVGSLYIMDP